MLPRATEYLFERIEQKEEYKEIGMVVSFLEVYLDRVRDLGRAYVDHHVPKLFNIQNQFFHISWIKIIVFCMFLLYLYVRMQAVVVVQRCRPRLVKTSLLFRRLAFVPAVALGNLLHFKKF